MQILIYLHIYEEFFHKAQYLKLALALKPHFWGDGAYRVLEKNSTSALIVSDTRSMHLYDIKLIWELGSGR